LAPVARNEAMFITFEGIEGCGKTLQIRRAEAWCRGKSIPTLLTREPGGTGFGVAVRQVLLSSGSADREPVPELLLYLADRVQHLKEVVLPALAKGVTILCDRYHDATRAYQGVARGIPVEQIDALARTLGIPEPDRTVLLDLDPQTGLERARRRNLESAGEDEGRFEAEAISFHGRVREAYLDLARRCPERIFVVPGTGTPDQVFSRIVPLLECWFGELRK
jgi:dTMP kinase